IAYDRDKALKANLESYPLRARAYHLAFIEHKFNAYIAHRFNPQFVSSRRSVYFDGLDTFSSETAIPEGRYFVLNMANPGPQLVGVDVYGEDEHGPLRDLKADPGQQYLQNRLKNGFLNEAYDYEESADQSIRIVEGVFGFGDKRISLTIKMRLHADQTTRISKFYAVSSVTRILCMKNPAH
ncbi:hypothetical protein EST38_g9762, partial [Candolleomyces aberdarensis]